MAEIEFLHDESPFWSHDFDFTSDPDLPPSDPLFDLNLGLGLIPQEDDDADDYSVWRRDSEDDIGPDCFDPDRFFDIEEVGEEEDGNGVQIGWDSFRLDEDRAAGGEDFEWEEVDERVDEREVLSVFFDADVDDDLDVSVNMEIPEEEELGTDNVSSLEWELLLNIHNLGPEGAEEEEDYEMLVGTEGRKPPASRGVVEGLAAAVVTEDDGEDCAICKDGMGVGEKVKSLPCSHRYHGFCIDIWLGMRNTCPVCRYELPTDDHEYERRRRERGGRA